MCLSPTIFLSEIKDIFCSGVRLKFSGGGRGSDTFKTPSPYEQFLPLPTPCFMMFLERSLNDPRPLPSHKHLSLLLPSLATTPAPHKTFGHTPTWQGLRLLRFCTKINPKLNFFSVSARVSESQNPSWNMKVNQEILTKLLTKMHQLSINLLYSSECQTTYSFCEISILSKSLWIHFEELLLKNNTYFITSFLSLEFSKLYFLQKWFIVSGKGDMSHFVGVGIFWIDLNQTDLGCWRLT